MLYIPRGITAIVGGGGKTALLMWLSKELSRRSRVIVTTSTHIWPPKCRVLLNPSAEEVKGAVSVGEPVAVGALTEEGKLAPARITCKELAELSDYVLVEADGSRGLPLKAPAEHEPAIPLGAALVLAVAGMDGVGRTINEAAHRPTRFAEIVGKPAEALVTPNDVAAVLMSESGQRKNVNCAFAVVLNKADTPERLEYARQTAALIPCDAYITALNEAHFIEHWRNGICL